MREVDAQAVLLVRAFEQSDPGGRLLGAEDRRRATQAARDAFPDDEEKLLARRAAMLLSELRPAVSWIDRALSMSRLGSGLAPLVLIVALAIGFASNALGPKQQINVLFAPMLGLVAWNLCVYLLLLVKKVMPGGGAGAADGATSGASASATWITELQPDLVRGAGLLTSAARWLVDRTLGRVGTQSLDQGVEIGAALGRYTRLWGEASVALVASRLAHLLHVGSMMFVLGAVGGMYVRGLGLLYRASWQSTFLDAGQVQGLLDALLGPAAVLLGRAVPDVAMLQFPADGAAASWIHLYAVTGVILVLLPRTVLALAAGRRSRALADQLPLDLRNAYYRRLLSPGGGSGRSLDVQTYGLRLDARGRDALTQLMHDVLGSRAEVRLAKSLDYGAEAEEARTVLNGESRDVLVVFSLAQSPEPEVHGQFVHEFAERLGELGALAVLVEGSGYRDRVGDAERRLGERQRAWERVLTEVGVTPLFAELDRPLPSELVEELGAALHTGLGDEEPGS